MSEWYLAVNECPHGLRSISLDNYGTHESTRLTDVKCCGRWNMIMKFKMQGGSLLDAAAAFDSAFEETAKRETGK